VAAADEPAISKELEDFKIFIQEHPRALAEVEKDPSLIRAGLRGSSRVFGIIDL
jgi:hypothetical protein